jgi:putative Mg2+ transporter-C (MgtC) family protein
MIGLERGRRQQAAGLRTHMMVCIGAASTMIVSEYMVLYSSGNGDIMRLGAQVVSGIGFLGAGTIIVTKQNRIRGLTTAASLWASACMGLVIGSGFYECAVIMMIMMLFVLVILSGFDIKYVKSTAYISLFIEMDRDTQFSVIIHDIKKQGWNIQEIRELEFLDSELLPIRIDMLSDDQVKKPVFCLDELREYDKIHFIEIM